MRLRVCVASKEGQGIETGGLPISVDTSSPWSVAANNLLDAAAKEEGLDGIIFADDDIELTPFTFDLLPKYAQAADIIGFSLFMPTDKGILPQSCGHQLLPNNGSVQLAPINHLAGLLMPVFCAHVSASCMYISQRVLQSGLRFPVWEGTHYEDVYFTIEAWRRGFKVAYVPGLVIHKFNMQVGAGRTKAQDEDFQRKRQQNAIRLQQYFDEIDLPQLCLDDVVPMHPVPIYALTVGQSKGDEDDGNGTHGG